MNLRSRYFGAKNADFRRYAEDWHPCILSVLPVMYLWMLWCFHSRARQRQDKDKTRTRQILNLCIPMMPFTPVVARPVSLPDRFNICLVIVLSLSCSGVKTPLGLKSEGGVRHDCISVLSALFIAIGSHVTREINTESTVNIWTKEHNPLIRSSTGVL